MFKSLHKKYKLFFILFYPLILIKRHSRKRIIKIKQDIYEESLGIIKDGVALVDVKDFSGTFQLGYRSEIFKRLFLYKRYEYESTEIVRKYVQPEKDVLDVGANIGLFSVLFSNLINDENKVLALEPNPTALKHLYKNIEGNNWINKVVVYEGVATNKKDSFHMNVIDGLEEYSSLGEIIHPKVAEKVSKRIKVNGNTIDNLVKDFNLNPGFMKIDAEGAEFEILRGAIDTITQFKPIILSEMSDRLLKAQGASSIRVLKLLEELNYNVLDINSFLPVNNLFEGDIIAFPN